MLFLKQSCRFFLRYPFLLLFPATAFTRTVTPEHRFPQAPAVALACPLRYDTSQVLLPGFFEYGAVAAAVPLNKQANGFVKTYLAKEEDYLQKIKNRSRPFFQTIDAILAQYHLPLQLKYLAVVESGLKPAAQSRAGARGWWQLMPSTARELGLKINAKTDQRLHLQRSTVAAAKYLESLYAAFGDWLLVLAAYNSGPGAVYGAIKKAGSKNFWVLQRFLPAESRGHVKHFIGIHYFFEGEGSIATQTKSEARAWQEKIKAIEAVRVPEKATWEKRLWQHSLDSIFIAAFLPEQELR